MGHRISRVIEDGNSSSQLQLERSGVSKVVQEKLIWNFHRSKFLILLGISRDMTQYSRISRSEI